MFAKSDVEFYKWQTYFEEFCAVMCSGDTPTGYKNRSNLISSNVAVFVIFLAQYRMLALLE